MKRKSLLLTLGLCALTQGCSPFYYVYNTMVVEPLHYNEAADKSVELTRDCQLAKQAWETVQGENPEAPYSDDYKDGFKAGYVDYLYAGGEGFPPALPPRRYWKPKYEGPQGRQAIEDWFAGFTQGSNMAKASGFRSFIPVPASAKAERKSDEYRATYGKQSQETEPSKGPEVLPAPAPRGVADVHAPRPNERRPVETSRSR